MGEGAFQMTYVNPENGFEHVNTNGMKIDRAPIELFTFLAPYFGGFHSACNEVQNTGLGPNLVWTILLKCSVLKSLV